MRWGRLAVTLGDCANFGVGTWSDSGGGVGTLGGGVVGCGDVGFVDVGIAAGVGTLGTSKNPFAESLLSPVMVDRSVASDPTFFISSSFLALASNCTTPTFFFI